MAYAIDLVWAMDHVRPWPNGHGNAMACAMASHRMSWLSMTYSRGHATDAPWPCLDKYAMVIHGHPWSSMAKPWSPVTTLGDPWPYHE